ncbi:uncharacterized protein CDV56_107740 [Aspergillus thermomutatus]|uniref:Uncharacterized protein n=1 Tax=Aspergillus thermomutatus TaxID=41047 RepID=A0A397HQ67_ASPTH|nr:uncharacterized protein CDV56_107740 [Aspergillus thermomutatus]RHZ63444.1 hypothetical protein CDV56_107740 [Aspergillus thermomutatus]
MMGPLRSYTKHTDIPAIAAEIRRLNPQSMEGEVNGVWNSILNWVFDPVNGFVTQPQAMHRQYGGKRGFSDFHTMSVAGGTRRSFLITQCKSAKGEGKDGVWDDGAEQLQRYLGTKHGMRPTAQRPAYGILARGLRGTSRTQSFKAQIETAEALKLAGIAVKDQYDRAHKTIMFEPGTTISQDRSPYCDASDPWHTNLTYRNRGASIPSSRLRTSNLIHRATTRSNVSHPTNHARYRWKDKIVRSWENHGKAAPPHQGWKD